MCFYRFWYHMNGRNIGSLSVVITKTDGTNSTIWRLDKTQGDIWLQGQVPLPAWTKTTKSYRVRSPQEKLLVKVCARIV